LTLGGGSGWVVFSFCLVVVLPVSLFALLLLAIVDHVGGRAVVQGVWNYEQARYWGGRGGGRGCCGRVVSSGADGGWVLNGGIGFCRHYIWRDKTRSTSSSSRPFISGRCSCTTRLEQVRTALTGENYADPPTVRKILPELVGQLVKLCSSDEFEQQDVSAVLFPSSSDDVFPICEVYRLGLVRPPSCVTSLAKRYWARLFRFCKTRSRRRMRGPGKVYASCCRTSCTSVPLMSFFSLLTV
jgi:hypothetical protein